MSCNHYRLLLDQPEPDFDVLLSRLSQYAFTRLSARDQQLQVEKIRQYVNEVEVQGNEESSDEGCYEDSEESFDEGCCEDIIEEQGNDETAEEIMEEIVHKEALSLRSSFSELLKKLSYYDQLGLFLSNAIKKLKWERIISSYKQLEVDHQKQIIWKSRVHRASFDGKTEEDFRLGIFTQKLCNYDLHYVHNLLIKYSNREDDEHEATSTFSELLKKVPYFHQLYLFLYKVILRFKRERPLGKEELISSFEQLEVDHQQQLIEEATVYIASMNGETEEGFRHRQFTELYRDHTDYVYDLLVNSSSREENEEEATFDDSLDTFGEFFLGFAKIWFEGQSKRSRDLLIEQFKKVAAGRKVADFRVQSKFLDFAEQKLGSWDCPYSYTQRLIGEPQEFDSAAELLCRLSAIGFSLLSAEYQQQTIETMIYQIERGLAAIDDDDEGVIRVKTFLKLLMSNQVERRLAVVEESKDEEQDMRVKTFTELFNQFSVPTRIELFKEFKRKLSDEVCLIRILKADEKWGRQGTSVIDDEEQESSPYAKFLFHVSVTWFKERSANYWRNPIPVILFGRKLKISDDIEKLPEENEEDFRLRRFTESFKRLRIRYREEIIQYIAEGLFRDLGYPPAPVLDQRFIEFHSLKDPDPAHPFASEWRDMIDFPPPSPQGAVGSATTQTGGGTSQGTSGPTKTTWLRSLIRRVF